MCSWRDKVLDEFVTGLNKLTFVADPDCLLTEEGMALRLKEKGFDLIEYEDSIAFRYLYEAKYRLIWDQGKSANLIVVVRCEASELERLPYDLLVAGHKLSFSLSTLFPHFSYRVACHLNRALLDKLYIAQQRFTPEPMGENNSKDFVLRHVYGFAPEMMDTIPSFLTALLRLHYARVQLPKILAERWAMLMAQSSLFEHWDLIAMISDEQAFYHFLQERWPLFLAGVVKNHAVFESFKAYGLKYAGPELIPFDHHDIRVYIDNLFIEGKLKPIKDHRVILEKDSWMRLGLVSDDQEDLIIRFERLFDFIKKSLPLADATYEDWLRFSEQWAELVALAYGSLKSEEIEQVKSLRLTIDFQFSRWLIKHFSSLVSLPPSDPVMVHHAPRYLARTISKDKHKKVALLVLDGLALNQWVTIREQFNKLNPSFDMRERALFAWIPTVTSVSRQAIFSGKAPFYFADSITTTNKEAQHWNQFWESEGLNKSEIVYNRSMGLGSDAISDLNSIIRPKTRIVGLVVDSVDKIMHGMQLGTSGMHNQVSQWIQAGYLLSMINELLEQDFDVWMTADHGNVEALGHGRPKEGVLAETRGERMRVYGDKSLLQQVNKEFNFALEWEPVGLPDNYFPLVISGNEAFITKDERIVGHGGVSLEEVIVPWIQFEKRV
jgi:hypothetical protein